MNPRIQKIKSARKQYKIQMAVCVALAILSLIVVNL